MRFSNKASRYLDKLSRDEDFVVPDKQAVIDYLRHQGIPPFEKIIEFQMNFSGLELTIINKPNSTFKASLFSKSDIEKNKQIDTIEINGQLYFYCGEHATAPFWFDIGDSGQICTYDNNDGTVNTIFSSFEKLIETYALEDLLQHKKKYEHPGYYNLIDAESFAVATQDFLQLLHPSDENNQWFHRGKLTIHKGTWLHEPNFFIHVYGENADQCDAIIQLLKDKQIIS